ncbi:MULTISPECIES: winged helix-turn-helix transcriptional regulator [Haloarcula]|uniref:Crp/Fnr family transcriptional regulator n=1 Tax=Haloarcula pellucida TaxID=1427151 RepID=A0A830GGZ2_9EURY|nr:MULTISPECIES: winged helix-turn-helix transcriptional regulator [Halomicroarcula]MBX0347029.1 winged helix-turn-helix transcriptional regulator [Halomicroarcula pellucida]MDS0277096.1 winged helix-turn-helix transcriptional regulator [Halomicroarcula sp. S1AR25-4]QIO22494.1 winged helix-turn-helix transcriptional regulator [Haloarcula sp. JP-L23]GGN86632.1 Crp/Fnr family transcriptional regulator [Halomicroarcula pellucida]
MVDVLENKRAATRFRILVEIAERQPAVSQGEIAEAVGVTSQAVSEYIRDLVDEGLVEKEGRSRYRVTKEGVDWVFQSATDMRRFVDHVTDDVLGSVQEDAAIAEADLAEGQTVSLSLSEGLLHAAPGDDGGATGVTTTSAEAGSVVGVTGFEGVIDLEPGHVSVLQVPPVRSGAATDTADIASACENVSIVTAAGVEAVAALREAGVEPTTYFAAGEVAADAASRGMDAVVVATQDTVGRVTDALRDASVGYDVTQ